MRLWERTVLLAAAVLVSLYILWQAVSYVWNVNIILQGFHARITRLEQMTQPATPPRK